MDHPSSILDNIKALFAWKRVRSFFLNVPFIAGKRLTPHGSLSKCKKPRINSKSSPEDFPLSHGDPVAKLELRKNHPLLVEYHFGFLRGRLGRHGKKKSR